MFTLWSLNKSKPVDGYTRIIILYALYLYRDYGGRHSAFLHDLPLSELEFLYCDNMNIDTGVMGAFSALHPKSIYLMKPRPSASTGKSVELDRLNKSGWPLGLFSTIVHELTHMWQRKKRPVLYTLCTLPGLREITLERDVKAAEEDARGFSDRLGNSLSSCIMADVIEHLNKPMYSTEIPRSRFNMLKSFIKGETFVDVNILRSRFSN